MSCLKCARGLHELCPTGCSGCHGSVNEPEVTEISYKPEPPVGIFELEDTEDNNPYEDIVIEVLSDDYRTGKSDASLKDQQSTGRKRAAKLYPLFRDKPCEWRGIELPGGSSEPIDDCVDGLQECRHHGPDYNTLNNDPGNVHRICHRHHNRWHAINDKYKDARYLELYGHKVKKSALSKTAKDLRSGVVNR